MWEPVSTAIIIISDNSIYFQTKTRMSSQFDWKGKFYQVDKVLSFNWSDLFCEDEIKDEITFACTYLIN